MSLTDPAPTRWTRRGVLLTAFGSVAAIVGAGVTGVELISHGVVPGKQALDELEGACSIAAPALRFTGAGISRSSSFYSSARQRRVGYTIAWPPGHPPGSPLPLIVMLHGYGANHTNALSGMTAAQAVALEIDDSPLPPMAMVTVDGGGGYWNPHPGDDPMAMVISELIPMCQGLNLGRSPMQIGTMGISMGGYGALLFAEKYPELIRSVAAISPAIWTTYDQSHAANRGAFASASAFASADVITHAAELSNTPVRVASGNDDPFHPGVLSLSEKLPRGATVELSKGCHTGPFFLSQELPSLRFLGTHLS
jgi:enterochelin esterase-like enzyme